MIDMFTSASFWLGLGQIAYVNLLLSGDNALVIALAVRTLPKRKRLLGQVWGAGGAVVLRLAFLAIVMYLLEVQYLRMIGGLLLVWIAFKLVQSETGVESEMKGGASLWEAIWIIIVADVTMSLDNVLAVAAVLMAGCGSSGSTVANADSIWSGSFDGSASCENVGRTIFASRNRATVRSCASLSTSSRSRPSCLMSSPLIDGRRPVPPNVRPHDSSEFVQRFVNAMLGFGIRHTS